MDGKGCGAPYETPWSRGAALWGARRRSSIGRRGSDRRRPCGGPIAPPNHSSCAPHTPGARSGAIRRRPAPPFPPAAGTVPRATPACQPARRTRRLWGPPETRRARRVAQGAPAVAPRRRQRRAVCARARSSPGRPCAGRAPSGRAGPAAAAPGRAAAMAPGEAELRRRLEEARRGRGGGAGAADPAAVAALLCDLADLRMAEVGAREGGGYVERDGAALGGSSRARVAQRRAHRAALTALRVPLPVPGVCISRRPHQLTLFRPISTQGGAEEAQELLQEAFRLRQGAIESAAGGGAPAPSGGVAAAAAATAAADPGAAAAAEGEGEGGEAERAKGDEEASGSDDWDASEDWEPDLSGLKAAAAFAEAAAAAAAAEAAAAAAAAGGGGGPDAPGGWRSGGGGGGGDGAARPRGRGARRAPTGAAAEEEPDDWNAAKASGKGGRLGLGAAGRAAPGTRPTPAKRPPPLPRPCPLTRPPSPPPPSPPRRGAAARRRDPRPQPGGHDVRPRALPARLHLGRPRGERQVA
jgi:hypothetical protein